ncbi:MAG: PQQ-dependent sugar dehydrogenase, partial [Chthoniobacter sp.]
NGGQLGFGPDGYLYISVGDGGSQHDNDYGHTGGQSGAPVISGNLGNAQDTTKLLGKVLRIDPLGTNGPGGSYGIPASNPFAGAGGGVREEIYCFGMRNPWRFSFDTDPVLGSRIIEADVGQDNVEEINLLVSGGNYGWRIKEGTFNHDNTAPSGGGALIDPVAEYAHPLTNLTNYPGLTRIGLAVVGGYVYRGSAIPSLVGQYVFGDYNTSTNSTPVGVLLALDSSDWSLARPAVVGNVSFFVMSMGQDEDGELYVATEVARGPRVNPSNGQPSGTIFKIVQAQTATITLQPVKDNTIFSESSALSNALGNIYAGETNNGTFRRGLLAFDISGSVPAGAVISSVQVSLNLNFTAATAAANMSLYKVSQSWGAGTSGPSSGAGSPATVNDATWGDRFYDPSSPTLWSVAGGTHASTASATTSVGTTAGFYNWSADQMVTDVQGWLTNSSTNFGWLLVGDETSLLTARRFDSRESAAGVQPALQITYAIAPPLTWRETWLRQYFTPVGTFVSDSADANGNSVSNLTEYAFSYSPIAANASSSGFQTNVSTGGGNTTYTMTFRRDPRAVDLTYKLQTTDDLVHWTTVVQSTAGAGPVGSAFVSEADAPGEAPVKIVTAVETLPSPVKHFSRLQILRSQ